MFICVGRPCTLPGVEAYDPITRRVSYSASAISSHLCTPALYENSATRYELSIDNMWRMDRIAITCALTVMLWRSLHIVDYMGHAPWCLLVSRAFGPFG